jgi:hypothetical protein
LQEAEVPYDEKESVKRWRDCVMLMHASSSMNSPRRFEKLAYWINLCPLRISRNGGTEKSSRLSHQRRSRSVRFLNANWQESLQLPDWLSTICLLRQVRFFIHYSPGIAQRVALLVLDL